MKTMICLILDRSGSMAGRQKDVVGGVNAFIEEQKKLPDPACIAFVRFDSVGIERFRPMQQRLVDCEPLTLDEYQPRASTPLLDAIGQTVIGLDEDWKIEKPDRAIVVIVTDGEENSSREYTKEKIKQLIQAREKSEKWAFIYMGANVDAFKEASAMGFQYGNTAGYKSTSRGTRAAYGAMGQSVMDMRRTGSSVANNLGGNIQEDGQVTKAQEPPTPPWQAPDATPSTPSAWTPPKDAA